MGRVQPTVLDLLLALWWKRAWPGFQSIRRLTRAVLKSDRVLTRTSFGSVFALNPDSYIDGIVAREGYYESEVLESIRPLLGNGAVLWDIGANFGLHAITAKFLHPGTAVVAFEPNPAMASEILANSRRNGLELRISPLALSDSAGAATFHVNDQGNSGMSTLHPWSEGHYDRQITVECARADAVVESSRFEAPTVVKLDVEGAEAAVLKGFGDLLRRPQLRAIVFEAAAGALDSGGTDPVTGLLRARGFTLEVLVRQESSHHPLENYLATR